MKRLLLFFLPLIPICSCKKDGTNSTIDSSIHVTMREEHKGSTTYLKLLLATEKQYSCSNYQINCSGGTLGNTISLKISGYSKPSFCLTSIGPAVAELSLGHLEPKTYLIEIDFQGRMYSGKLKVDEGAYQLSFNKSKPFLADKPLLRRIPTSTIWGYVGYHKSGSFPKVQGFLDSLVYLGAGPANLSAGDYNEFTIDPGGQIQTPANTGYYFYQPFVMKYPGNLSLVNQLVKNYGCNLRDSMNIGLYTHTGEFYHSW